MEYLIIESTDPIYLARLIEEKIKDGWTLQGGVSVSNYKEKRYYDLGENFVTIFVYAQAMTKGENNV